MHLSSGVDKVFTIEKSTCFSFPFSMRRLVVTIASV